jgi:hypothetical protein
MLIKLPNGAVVNSDNVLKMAVTGTSIVFTHLDGATTTSYATGSNGAANSILNAILTLPSTISTIDLELVPVVRQITAIAPTSVVGSAGSSITITGVNMIDDAMIAAGEAAVYANGVVASIYSVTPTSIVATLPVISAGPVTIAVLRANIYYITPTTLCSDNTFLTAT